MDNLLEQGITAYKAGNRDEARKIFIAATKSTFDTLSTTQGVELILAKSSKSMGI